MDSLDFARQLEHFSGKGKNREILSRNSSSHMNSNAMLHKALRQSLPYESYPIKNGEIDDLELAALMQIAYNAENDELAAQMHYLLTAEQEVFECGICFETLPIDDIARIDGCRHQFCRDCLRSYVSSKIEDRKFPISCPDCSVRTNNDTLIGMVNELLLHQLGISEQAYKIFNELQLVDFSILLDCRRCGRGVFVDKAEFQSTKILQCPLPSCNFSWCKDCQQEFTVSPENPTHSCDGSEELARLMSKTGWKNCPTCKTPIEKVSGCNFMSCKSPGCNTHFCYGCGMLVILSAVSSAVATAKSNHYKSCRVT